MPRKKKKTTTTTPASLNIIGRAWDFIALSLLTPITKVKKPVAVRCRNLFLLKRGKRRHYNYAFISEYEFSPSSTPLFGCQYRLLFKKKARARLLSLLICGSNVRTESGFADDGFEREPYGQSDYGDDDDGDGDGSVDLRAEKFIERFYEEMRINLRRRSL